MGAAGAIIGLGASIAGSVMQIDAAQKIAKAQEKELGLQQQNETVRETAARLDAQRRKREIVRQQIISQSNALSEATNQSAQYGTLLPGAQYAYGAQSAKEQSGVTEQLLMAQDIFSNNRQILEQKKAEAKAGAESALGAGISSIGGALGKSLGSLGKLG
jgi:hypothetical protein